MGNQFQGENTYYIIVSDRCLLGVISGESVCSKSFDF